MKEWHTFVTEYAILITDALALVIIVFGTIEAFINSLRLIFLSSARHEQRDVWLGYARWLVAGLRRTSSRRPSPRAGTPLDGLWPSPSFGPFSIISWSAI